MSRAKEFFSDDGFELETDAERRERMNVYFEELWRWNNTYIEPLENFNQELSWENWPMTEPEPKVVN